MWLTPFIAINKIGRILTKLDYVCIVKHSKSLYLVRILDGETVAKNNRSMDELSVIAAEQEENEQIIRLEEDLAGGATDEDTPF